MTDLRPRADVVHNRLASGELRVGPWNYTAEHLDENAVTWTTRTGLDGSLVGLYLQLPYGYQYDVGSDDSVILKSVARSMRKDGHDDWAKTVETDMVSDVLSSCSRCQSVGISYDAGYPIDEGLLDGLAEREIYKIYSFNEDLMDQPAKDELRGVAPGRKMTGLQTMGVLAASIFVDVLATAVLSDFNTFIALVLGTTAAVVMFKALRNAISNGVFSRTRVNRKNDVKTSVVRRPGYILPTSEGWLIWQYDSGTATPAELTDAALKALDDMWSNSTGVSPVVDSTFVSSDGRMVWVKSGTPTGVTCDLSPYDAEQYLSIYLYGLDSKRRGPFSGGRARKYGERRPTIITGSIADTDVMHGISNGASRSSIVASTPNPFTMYGVTDRPMDGDIVEDADAMDDADSDVNSDADSDADSDVNSIATVDADLLRDAQKSLDDLRRSAMTLKGILNSTGLTGSSGSNIRMTDAGVKSVDMDAVVDAALKLSEADLTGLTSDELSQVMSVAKAAEAKIHEEEKSVEKSVVQTASESVTVGVSAIDGSL